MAEPKKGVVGLSEGAKTYCEEWYLLQRYGIEREIKSKYFDKGNACEPAAILRYAGEFAEKNEREYEGEYMKGTPDLIFAEKIADLKCPFDIFTFPYFEAEPAKEYWWQLQGYMHLTDRATADLVYCLEDTPPRNQWDEGQCYDSVPDAERIKIYTFGRDDDAIKQIIERVKLCREYIANHITPLFP